MVRIPTRCHRSKLDSQLAKRLTLERLEDRLTPATLVEPPVVAPVMIGGLDVTFSNDGKDLPLLGGNNNLFFSVAVQKDGKIVAVGAKKEDFLVVRMMPDGSLDKTFGTDGILTIDFGGRYDFATDVALFSDGRIAVTGTTASFLADGSIDKSDFAVAILQSDGTPEDTVNFPGGVKRFSVADVDVAFASAIDSQDRLIIVGGSYASVDDRAELNFSYVRLTPTGKLDQKDMLDFDGGADIAFGVTVDADDGFLMVGTTFSYVSGRDDLIDVAMVYVDSMGDVSLKQTVPNPDALDIAFDAAIDSKGRFVIAGLTATEADGADVALVRMDQDGTLDYVFGGDTGVRKVDLGSPLEYASTVRINKDDKIILIGSTSPALTSIQDLKDLFSAANLKDIPALFESFADVNAVVVRLTSKGTFDPAFNEDGLRIIDFGGIDAGFRGEIDNDGQIVMVGTAFGGIRTDPIIARVIDQEPVEEPPIEQPPIEQPPVIVPKPQQILVGGRSDGTALLFNPSNSQYSMADTLTFFGGTADTVRTATADINGDGTPDFVGGTGPGVITQIVVIDGKTKTVIASWQPFESGFTGGVFLAVADLDKDGKAEIIVTPDQGGGPVVAVYSGARIASGVTGDAAQLIRFFGIEDANFRGGARAAMGDVNGDGIPDLIVSAGFEGGPRIAVFNGGDLAAGRQPGHLIADFFAFEDTLRNGAFVASGDLTGDGVDDIAFGGGPGGGPRVRVFDGKKLLAMGSFSTLDQVSTGSQVANFFAGDSGLRGGTHLDLHDMDGDGKQDLVVGSGENEGSKVRVYKSATILADPTGPGGDQELDPFGAALGAGVFVG